VKKAYELIKPVLERFPGLPESLHRLFKKSAVWYRSHGYELRNDNPLSNGNPSALDHLFEMADQYEAAAPGAGKALLENIGVEGRVRYAPEPLSCDDRELRRSLNKEFYEALEELDKKDLSDQSPLELVRTEAELAQIETVIAYAIAHVRAEMKRKQSGGKPPLRVA
jgi:hypothetical protein